MKWTMNYTFEVEKSDWFTVLEERDRKLITEELANFCQKSVEKYIKGQKEHGGFLADREALPEMENELFDFFWYMAAAKYRCMNYSEVEKPKGVKI